MVKSQTLGGRRAKAGGIAEAEDDAGARAAAAGLLASSIGGEDVGLLLVERRVVAREELYIAYALDFASEQLWLLFSLCGGSGMDAPSGDHVLRIPISVRRGPDLDSLRRFLASRRRAELWEPLSGFAKSLYECARRNDLLLAEVNPLLVALDGALVVADARVEVDDGAVFRQEWIRAMGMELRGATDRESAAAALGTNGLVELEGDVAVVANGAGLAMASMDLLEAAGLHPAGFLETGGAVTAELVQGALALWLRRTGLRGVLVNLYGGINSMVAAAEGVATALSERPVDVPIVVALRGNEAAAAWEILEAAGVATLRTIETEAAVERLAALLGESR